MDYSPTVCHALIEQWNQLHLDRPSQCLQYDPGDELEYTVQSLAGRNAQVRVRIEKLVEGSLAGQVYQVTALDCQPAIHLPELVMGSQYTLRIFVPPTIWGKFFRNMLYWMAFQGAFQLQVNPYAARAGALLQKIIRKAAKIRLGSERYVADVYGTLLDSRLGSCGELGEWIAGRTRQGEANEKLDVLGQHDQVKPVPATLESSPEYAAKKKFMLDFVALLHEVGAHDLVRQYEGTTWKKQRHCVQREGSGDHPETDLVAVFFRPGLPLLPSFPMSLGACKRIGQNIRHGHLVQFDRIDLTQLQNFVRQHPDEFSDMQGMVQELQVSENVYRQSLLDITHHHIHLIKDPQICRRIGQSAVTSWRIRGIIDSSYETQLRSNTRLIWLFFVLGILPGLGLMIRRWLGHPAWHRHYAQAFKSLDYFKRAWRGNVLEKLMAWYRTGRINPASVESVSKQISRYWYHWALGILPRFIHRIATDSGYTKEIVLVFQARIQKQEQARQYLSPQFGHVPLLSMIFAGILVGCEYWHWKQLNQISGLSGLWYLAMALPFLLGMFITLGCGGAKFKPRILAGTIGGAFLAVFSSLLLFSVFPWHGSTQAAGQTELAVVATYTWGAWFITTLGRLVLFPILCFLGALIAELALSDEQKRY